tara:strand:- start:385 stop:1530 length:1146 start_codon:yes stop_codon:yes gene_type:complete
MIKKKYTIVIDASRNKSGGAIVYMKNFIKHIKIESTSIEKIILFSYKNLLYQIPKRSFLIKKNHFFLEKNIFFQIFWQWFLLPIYLKKNKNNILFTTDSTSFCRFKPSIVFNQDLLGFDKNAFNQISFGLEKLRLYLIKYIQIKTMNAANEIIFLSKFSQKVISKSLKKKLSYKIIPHGIEKKLIRLGKKNIKNFLWDYRFKKKIRIVYVSPLFHYKNHLTVVKAYSRLKKKYNNLDIKFVGGYKHDLRLYKSIINESKFINKSHFTGKINQDNVIKILTKSDIFVFASSSETFGISLLEAMIIGMPIVCSNKSSLPEILQNGGLYFNPKNDSQLANQIELMIKNKELRKKKSKEAKKEASKFSWNKNTQQFCNLISKLTK